MQVLTLIYLLITYAVTAVIVLTVLLMLARLIMNFADVNPFGRMALTVRRMSDPLVSPVRGALMGFGADPKYAPLITILLVILVGYFALQLAASVLNTITGVLVASGLITFPFAPRVVSPIAVVGYLLYGMLALYSLLIFIRIIFSWGMVSYRNPMMRFLVNATDPLLVPLRRMIPPLGVMDISPIVAFILLWLFEAAVAGTLLRGWPTGFFG